MKGPLLHVACPLPPLPHPPLPLCLCTCAQALCPLCRFSSSFALPVLDSSAFTGVLWPFSVRTTLTIFSSPWRAHAPEQRRAEQSSLMPMATGRQTTHTDCLLPPHPHLQSATFALPPACCSCTHARTSPRHAVLGPHVARSLTSPPCTDAVVGCSFTRMQPLWRRPCAAVVAVTVTAACLPRNDLADSAPSRSYRAPTATPSPLSLSWFFQCASPSSVCRRFLTPAIATLLQQSTPTKACSGKSARLCHHPLTSPHLRVAA